MFLLISLLCLLYVVEHKDAGADEYERDEEVYKLYGAFLGEHKLCKKHTKHGCHKAEDSNLGNGIELQEHTPEGVCDSGEEGEVDEDDRALEGEVIDLSAADKSDDDHYRTTEHELISADNNWILVL